MHAEKLGLNTEWVQSMDLPPRLRSIVEDNKVRAARWQSENCRSFDQS